MIENVGDVISSDPPFKNLHVRFTVIPFHLFNCGFYIKVTYAFLQERLGRKLSTLFLIEKYDVFWDKGVEGLPLWIRHTTQYMCRGNYVYNLFQSGALEKMVGQMVESGMVEKTIQNMIDTGAVEKVVEKLMESGTIEDIISQALDQLDTDQIGQLFEQFGENGEELSFCHRLWFVIHIYLKITPMLWTYDILYYCRIKYSRFKISNVYTIMLQR